MNSSILISDSKFDKWMAVLSITVFIYFAALTVYSVLDISIQIVRVFAELLTIPMLLTMLVLLPTSFYKWYLGKWNLTSFAFFKFIFAGHYTFHYLFYCKVIVVNILDIHCKI